MTEAELGQLQTFRSRCFVVPSRQHLFQQGERHDETYTLHEGWMLVYRTSEDGKRQILRSALAGDFLGFRPDLHAPLDHSAMALTDCTFCAFSDLVEMCRAHPALALRLAWLSACNMLMAEVQLANVAKRPARERVAAMVLQLYQRLQLRRLNQGFKIPFPLLQEDIADALGLTVVHVNRTLRRLRDEGVFKLERHELTILDYDALVAMSSLELEPLNTCNI